SLLQSTERQVYVIFATILAGIMDLSVAWVLIPAHGAVGACIGSGAAQILAVGMMWAICIRLFRVKLPWRLLFRITAISILAPLARHYVAVHFSSLWAILLGGAVSLVVFFSLLYLLRVLEPQ